MTAPLLCESREPAAAPAEALYATFPRRLNALTADTVLLAALLLPLAMLGPLDAWVAGRVIDRAVWCAVLLLYEPGQVAWFGGTAGHRLLNLQVVDDRTGGNLTLTRAFARSWLKLLLGVISFLGMAFTRRHQAIHDVLTRSTVRIRNPAQAQPYHYVREGEPLIARVPQQSSASTAGSRHAAPSVPAPPVETDHGP